MNYKQKSLSKNQNKIVKQTQDDTHLTKLINQLTYDIKLNHVKNIKNPQGLLQSLIKLQNVIGMDKLKENIAKQTSYLIQKLNVGNFKLSMLNTVLYGSAGLGKTTIGIILA